MSKLYFLLQPIATQFFLWSSAPRPCRSPRSAASAGHGRHDRNQLTDWQTDSRCRAEPLGKRFVIDHQHRL